MPPTVRPIGDADPSQIPLHQTPKKNEHGNESDDDGVFGVKTEGTPYFQDSHMVPPRSSNRTDRLARDTEASNAQRGNARASSGRSRRRFVLRDDSSDDDSDGDDYHRKEDAEYDDPSDELARQVIEGYYSAKREGSEHVCDYLNRLNGYARNAGVQFEKGGRESNEHVNRFLKSCGDRWLERRLCHLRVKDIYELEDIINDIKSEERGSTRETSAYHSRGRDRSHGRDERRAETPSDGYRRDRHDRHGRGYDRRMDDFRHTPRISLAEASLSEMMTEMQVRESKYGTSERSKSRDMRRSLENSSSEDAEDRLTDEDQSESDYADPYHSDEHDRHVAAANDAERRTEAIGTYGRSENRGRRGDFPNRRLDLNSRHQGLDRQLSLQRRFKLGSPPTEIGLVPIGLQQLASPPVDTDCVYAFVFESKWLKTQRREEVNEMNTMETEKERNGSFSGGGSDERKTEEWNSGGSEGLVLSVTKKTWHDYQPENGLSANAQPPTNETNELWVRMTKELIPKVVEFRRGRPRRVRVTNISDRLATCPVHPPLLLWVPRGDPPRTEGYVRLGSDKYNEWRVLAYSRSRDSDLYKAEGEIYKRWLAAQPSAVEIVPYTTPTKILRRPSESSEGSVSDRHDQAGCAAVTTEPSTEMVAEVVHQDEARPKLTAHSDRMSEGSQVAQLKLEGAYLAAATVSEDWGVRDAPNASEHPGTAFEFDDYARE
ncbi:unnamed protein product [Phytophthora fragariaefolia]|uniref:Unnamed protein product n=1 Tax=Phytophthora fragariaefolia TaxID=1490495 RepID=A0A9W6XA82_9STRA|nr:unnamed protein product [Phytophthora fragariaefolia]